MKTLLQIVLFCSVATGILFADTSVIDNQLNKLWRDKDYAGIKSTLETNLLSRAPDVGLLYCAKFFFVFVDPSKAKALASLGKLKEVAVSTGRATFIDFATHEFDEVQNLPDSTFAPREVNVTANMLQAIHSEFGDIFPNIELAASTRVYMKATQ